VAVKCRKVQRSQCSELGIHIGTVRQQQLAYILVADVADALIRKQSFPADIPAWMEEGFRRESNRPSRLTGMVRDQLSEEMKKSVDEQMVSM
jgi:hypothetical protein